MSINLDKKEKNEKCVGKNTGDFSSAKKEEKKSGSNDYISSALTMMIVLMSIACFCMMTKL